LVDDLVHGSTAKHISTIILEKLRVLIFQEDFSYKVWVCNQSASCFFKLIEVDVSVVGSGNEGGVVKGGVFVFEGGCGLVRCVEEGG
jgi:hypothetical protein